MLVLGPSWALMSRETSWISPAGRSPPTTGRVLGVAPRPVVWAQRPRSRGRCARRLERPPRPRLTGSHPIPAQAPAAHAHRHLGRRQHFAQLVHLRPCVHDPQWVLGLLLHLLQAQWPVPLAEVCRHGEEGQAVRLGGRREATGGHTAPSPSELDRGGGVGPTITGAHARGCSPAPPLQSSVRPRPLCPPIGRTLKRGATHAPGSKQPAASSSRVLQYCS